MLAILSLYQPSLNDNVFGGWADRSVETVLILLWNWPRGLRFSRGCKVEFVVANQPEGSNSGVDMSSGLRWIVFGVGLTIAACGGGGTDYPPQRPSGGISGVAHDGRIVEGNVRAYQFAGGQKGDLLGTATTDEQGAFTLEFVAPDQPIMVEVDGGRYVEEATNTTVSVKAGKGLTALGLYRSGEGLTINVTPLSLLATGLAEYKISTGIDAAQAIEQANSELADIFGIHVTATTPRDLRVAGETTTDIDASTLYGFLLASFSSYTAWLADKNDNSFHDQYPSINLARVMYDDIRADGVLDGVAGVNGDGAPNVLTFAGAELNQNVYRSAMAQHMLVTASSPANKTGITARDLLARATTFASSSGPVFPGSNSAALDLEGPVITANDGLGVYYRGDIQFGVSVADQSPVSAVSFALDGATLGDAPDVNDPGIVIRTADYADGEHTLDVTAFDDVGNLGSESFILLFDNTDPVFTVTSPTLTNQSRLTITGTYERGGSALSLFQVQGAAATVAGDGTWRANVRLNPGENPISILIRDEANNTTESTVFVSMDNLLPDFTGSDVIYSDEALFDLGSSTCYVGKLRSVASNAPLYFNKNKVVVTNVIPKQKFSWFDLHLSRIPFLRFYVIDRAVGGVSTPASQIKVEMQYSLGTNVLVPYKTLPIHDDPNTSADPYFLIPLASDYLHPSWTGSAPQDEHKITIRLTDNAGNSRSLNFSFWAVFGDADCTIL